MNKNAKLATIASISGIVLLAAGIILYLWYNTWSKPEVTELSAGDSIPGRFAETITEDDLYKIGYDTGEETIVVDVNEETPEIIITQTQEKLDAIDVNTADGILEAQELMDAQGEATQKRFILVYKDYYACSPDEEEFDESEIEYKEGWTYYGSMPGGFVPFCDDGEPWQDKDKLLAALEEAASNSYQPNIAVILEVDNEVDLSDVTIPEEDMILPEPTVNPTSAPEGGEFFGDI